MENEKSTKRAILAAAACEGIYIAIGIAVQLITTIVVLIVTSSSVGREAATSLALATIVILVIAAGPIAYFEYKLAMRLIPRIAVNTPTTILGFRILGWLLIGLNVIDFFLSVSGQSSASFAGIVIGILYIRHAKKLDKQYTDTKECHENQKPVFPDASAPATSEADAAQLNATAVLDIQDDNSYV